MEKVGAPDPERKTSPILDDDAELSLDAELEVGMCYFNDVAYPIGTCVESAGVVLCCLERGVWVRKGEVST